MPIESQASSQNNSGFTEDYLKKNYPGYYPDCGQDSKDKRLIKYIKNARKAGYDDSQLKEILLKNGWAPWIIDEALLTVKISKSSGPKYSSIKNPITVYLDIEVMEAIEKRAKKNMFTLQDQIEDILRRSCVQSKKIKQDEDKLDDMFVRLFSRKNTGRPKKA
jgi:hypothetical protein